MTTLNLGIVAHVDAGKTSLTERLLYDAGVIDRIGRVDDGSTQTDSSALERERGITIRSAVVSFEIGDVTVDLIDTPGHPDFIAEVERVLGVLDGAVLVVSAVEGVQAQTRILMRTLRRLRIPTVIFVNKIDRAGARFESLLDEITGRLGIDAVPMGWVDGMGSRTADFRGSTRPVIRWPTSHGRPGTWTVTRCSSVRRSPERASRRSGPGSSHCFRSRKLSPKSCFPESCSRSNAERP
jgi:ribosomal protection tetracycline resistance protein